MSLSPIPDRFHTLTPVLVSDDCERLLQFLKEAFDAQELDIMRRPDGVIVHGDLMIGDSPMMISQANPQFPATSSVVHLYVADCDGTYRRAVAAGAATVRPPEQQFYGDVNAVVTAAGTTWSIGTRVEHVSKDELRQRAEAFMARP